MTYSDKYIKERFKKLRNDNSGNASMLVIIGLIVVFAIMLSGGMGRLTSGTTPSALTPSPSESSSTLQPLPTIPNLPNSASIQYTPGSCIDESIRFSRGILQVNSSSSGTLRIEVQKGSTYTPIITSQFSAPSGRYNIILSNTDGFNNQPWRIILSTEDATQTSQQSPTGC